MKKLFVLAVCCLMLVGCENINNDKNRYNNDFQNDNEELDKIDFTKNYLYCGLYTKDTEKNNILSYESYEIYFDNNGTTNKICYSLFYDEKNLGTNCNIDINDNNNNYELALSKYTAENFVCFLTELSTKQ